MKVIDNGTVTNPKGYKGTGLHIGIKKKNKDFALIVSDVEAKAVGTFTTNMVKAAPVLWDKHIVENYETVKAIAINSGIANACTGELGNQANEKFASIVGDALEVDKEKVLICSTGVIGKQLPTEPIEKGIGDALKQLKDDHQAGIDVATSIMTTDTKPKHLAVEIEVGGKTVTIGACCKGSGMIHPNMCTMLAFLTTDAAITKKALQCALSEDVEDTYNMISVDGDTSTNDTVLLLANGMADNKKIKYGTKEYEQFKKALHYVNETLAKEMAGDGEGATALFEVKVVGAKTKEQAKVLSKSIVCSNLTKTAIAGHDANWGRILCAMGYSGAQFDPEKVDLFFESAAGKLQIIENGVALNYSEEKATEILSEPKVTAIADLKEGDAAATAWGCDLTHEYISINADYRS